MKKIVIPQAISKIYFKIWNQILSFDIFSRQACSLADQMGLAEEFAARWIRNRPGQVTVERYCKDSILPG
jgi:hypothetical protein